VEPTGQRLLLANGRGVLAQHQKRRLKRVLGIGMVVEHVPAHAQDELPVPGYQRAERRFIVTDDEALEELAVGQCALRLGMGQEANVSDNTVQLRHGHVENALRF
jgi:hypothetical protein